MYIIVSLIFAIMGGNGWFNTVVRENYVFMMFICIVYKDYTM